MILDISTGRPTHEQNRSLALAIVRQAISEWDARDAELRADARFFLEHSLWWPDLPWAGVLELDRVRFMRGLRRKLAEDKADAFLLADTGSGGVLASDQPTEPATPEEAPCSSLE